MKALPVVAALLLWVVATTAAAEQAWYLMSPPGNHLTFEVFDNAPLHHWIKLEAFDTELTCQVRRRLHIEWQADWMIPLIGKPEWPLQESFLQAMLASRCVPANDPRLFAAPAAKPPKVAVAPRQTYTPLADDVGTIRYTPGRPIVAVVRLNGRSSARLILDTGADGSMVKPDLLAAAGVDLSRPSARGTGTSVTSKTRLSYFSVDFEVAGHRALVPHVAAFNMYDDDVADGLLGRDFLDRFKVVMDPAAGTVTLVPRLGAK